MIAVLVRRLGVLMLGLALAFGPLAHAGMAMQPNMDMSAHADAAMPMPEGCDLCGDGAGAMDAAACFAGCAMPGAILAPLPLLVGESGQMIAAVEQPAATDRHRPPDPHPPKSVSMI